MPVSTASELDRRLEALGRQLGEREAEHAAGLAGARASADALRERVCAALERFHTAATAAGAPHLRIEVSPVRVDDKHLRAVEFDLTRGRHRAIVVAKARGEVTLVGPFHAGKNEGPCRSFPVDATAELSEGLASFLERFAEEAATP
jgi:hypothetical protein